MRKGIPIAFRCGRMAVLLLDTRGGRDLWRSEHRAVDPEQWTAVNTFVSKLPGDIDALVVVTTVPIVGMSAESPAQLIVGGRDEDVELFSAGDEDALLHFQYGATNALAKHLTNDLDDIRDQWANQRTRAEQEAVIRLAIEAR